MDSRLLGRLADETGDPRLAHILFACAKALADEANNWDQMSSDISRLVTALVAN